MREEPFSWWAHAHARTDAAALAAFRILFGLLVATSALRFLAFGWVDRFFVAPRFFFPYWGFGWVAPLPAPWIHGAFVVLALSGIGLHLLEHHPVLLQHPPVPRL